MRPPNRSWAPAHDQGEVYRVGGASGVGPGVDAMPPDLDGTAGWVVNPFLTGAAGQPDQGGCKRSVQSGAGLEGARYALGLDHFSLRVRSDE